MATRQEIQIAQDLIRFVNIMNDLIDCISYMLREKNPQNGDTLEIEPGVTATVSDIKTLVQTSGQNITGYDNMITEFFNRVDSQNVEDALLQLGVSLTDVQADLSKITTEVNYVTSNLQAAKTKADLAAIADHIDGNVSKLTLIRRSWCIGL